MATIYREFTIRADADAAWQQLRDPNKIAELMPMLATAETEGDRRVCNTVDGGRLDETILGIDDAQRRIAYTITDSPFPMEFHAGSMQIIESDGSTGFRWITDVKPDALAEQLAVVIDAQVEGLRNNLT